MPEHNQVVQKATIGGRECDVETDGGWPSSVIFKNLPLYNGNKTTVIAVYGILLAPDTQDIIDTWNSSRYETGSRAAPEPLLKALLAPFEDEMKRWAQNWARSVDVMRAPIFLRPQRQLEQMQKNTRWHEAQIAKHEREIARHQNFRDLSRRHLRMWERLIALRPNEGE